MSSETPSPAAWRASGSAYIERPPLAELVGAVRTVWIQRTDGTAYPQRHMPTGGVELHFPVGAPPQFLGPLTGPKIEVIPPYTTLVGVRFHPGSPPPLPEEVVRATSERYLDAFRKITATELPITELS